MLGPLAQLVALTSYGNDYLKHGRSSVDFGLSNSTFQFCNKVEFQEFKERAFTKKYKEKVVATDPAAWFQYLKDKGCIRLCLFFYDVTKDPRYEKDPKIAELAAGGVVWFIETVYPRYSNYWESRWIVTNEHATDNKIWTVNYRMLVDKQRVSNVQISENLIKNDLRDALTEAVEFATKQKLTDWIEVFNTSLASLNSETPEEGFFHSDLVPPAFYRLRTKQIIFSAVSSWVFGFAGSWDNLQFSNNSVQRNYERITKQLYTTVIDAIIAGANTF